MADVNINKFRASVVRDGSKPASPGFIVSEGQDPVNPPGTNNYVPYSGATANVELGEYGVEAGFITLDTTPTNTPTDQGTIFWDADDETVDIVLNGYTMKIGEDLFYPVKNQTGSTIAKGVAVRFNGTVGNSGRLLIAPFIADGSVPSSRFMGVTAEEILNGEDGKVLYFGRVRGINTNAFNEGDILYASTTVAGGYQTAIPVAPNNIVQVAAVVTKSATVGTIFVRPTLGSNINTDEGVKIVSVADKNLLQYQSGTGLWENKTLAQVLGGTSSQFVKGDGSLDSTSYQPLLTNPVTGTGASGQVAYFTGTSAISSESNLFWDATNDRLGIGTGTPSTILQANFSNSSAYSSGVTGNGLLLYNTSTTNNQYVGLYFLGEPSAGNAGQATIYGITTGSGAMDLAFSTRGSSVLSERLRITSGGNLGIGTETPNDLIEIKSSLANQANYRLYNTFNSGANNFGVKWFRNYDSATNSLACSINYVRTGGSSGYMDFHTGNVGAVAERMRINENGNIIIQSGGTPSDNGARLQVSGTATFSGAINATNGLFNSDFLANETSKVGISFASGYGQINSWGANTSTYGGLKFQLSASNGGTFNALTLAPTGAATFIGSVGIGGATSTNGFLEVWKSGSSIAQLSIGQNSTYHTDFFIDASGNFYIQPQGTTRLTISASTGAATFSSSVTSVGLISSSTVRPSSNYAADLGTSSFRWADIFGFSLNVASSVTAASALLDSTSTQLILKNVNGGTNAERIGMFMTDGDFFKILSLNDNNTTRVDNIITANILNGNVGIGTASPTERFEVNGLNGNIRLYGRSGISNNSISSNLFYNGSAWVRDNASFGAADINFGSSNNSIIFSTSAATSGSVTERLRIDSVGTVDIKGNNNNVSGMAALIARLGSNADNTSSYGYILESGGINRCFIYGNGNIVNSNNSYGALSDIKLKENITDASYKLDDLMKVKVRNFNYIGDNKKQIGVIAQELEQIFPSMIDESEDYEELEVLQLDKEGNAILNEEGKEVFTKERVKKGTTTKSVKYSVFVPMLIKAIQELKQEIDTLKN